jgi:hypothetical protein
MITVIESRNETVVAATLVAAGRVRPGEMVPARWGQTPMTSSSKVQRRRSGEPCPAAAPAAAGARGAVTKP